jgi:hypothetical protein
MEGAFFAFILLGKIVVVVSESEAKRLSLS